MIVSMKNAVRRASGALALAVIAAASLLSVMTAHAAETSDDCFGGALSQDPLHCYVLEQAHNESIIEVDGVYHGGKTLYIFLVGEEPLEDDSEEYNYFRTKAQEEVSRNGGDQCVLDPSGCPVGFFYIGTGFLLPASQGYQNIRLLPGGNEALRSQLGWASFRQWWPSVAETNTQRRGIQGETQPSTGFDVSDVELGNFSPLDCSNYASNTNGCQQWELHPGIGIAGWHSNREKLYVQVKAPNGEASKIEAARQALIEENPRGLNENNLVIVPVNHDYQDLSHYAELLDRFALSAGNTVGIIGGEIYVNWAGTYQGPVIYPLTELPPVERGDLAGLRETIFLETIDLQGTVDALPQLLPQLGIPVDAVGMVVQRGASPGGIITLDRGEASPDESVAGLKVNQTRNEAATLSQGSPTSSGDTTRLQNELMQDPSSETQNESNSTSSGQLESSTWVIGGSAGLALVLLVLVTAFLWRKRLAKRKSTQ